MHLAAVLHDLAPHLAHDILEDVRADMGLGLFHDVRRSAMRGERFEHGLAQRIADARGQLAVRVRARAALAELDIAVRVERAAAPERIYRPVALVHIAAALEYDRTEAVPGERVRREQSGRAETHDDRTVRKALFAVRNGRTCIFFITHRRHLQLFRKCLLVAGCVQTHRIYAGDLAAARVDADAAHRSLGLRR